MPNRGRKRSLSSQVAGLAAAASLPATVSAIMFATGRWDWQVLALVLILSLPLYRLGRPEHGRRGALAGPLSRDRR